MKGRGAGRWKEEWFTSALYKKKRRDEPKKTSWDGGKCPRDGKTDEGRTDGGMGGRAGGGRESHNPFVVNVPTKGKV